jgi:para-aminobenzoate synthetase/4-amino-4-deoxychorismate lyase
MMAQINKNEALLRDQEHWLHFRDPHQILSCDSLDTVIPALSEIERLVEENGWYAAGFLTYESASAFDPALPSKPIAGFPYLWFGLYPKPNPVNLPEPRRRREELNWQPTVYPDQYRAAISTVKEYIAEGKTYQVNYTMRLQAEFSGSAWDFFLHLAQSQNNHAAYIDGGRYVICSASPELFFQLDGNTVTSRPMKGTAKRGRTTQEDLEKSEWLRRSEKNRAENVMIVDMIRNDLGRIAEVGSVQVPELFCTERYPTLWQMTSTITGQTHASITNICRALFPCASVTGAPKVSTMQIIHELETTPRKIYTGSIGYITPKRKARFNVAIRTVLIDRQNQKAEYGVGGGIVWDSTSDDEYEEALLKAHVLTQTRAEFSLLETLRWTPNEGFYLREKHLVRLLDSGSYFDFSVSRDAIEKKLDEISSSFKSQQRIRLLLERSGNVIIESLPFMPSQTTIHARLAKQPVDSDNVFLFHKTTHRVIYDNARADCPDCDDVLLYNERGELTEFTIGNLVVALDGQLITPPVECGLLAGTFRAQLLATGQVAERAVPMERFRDCRRIFRVNSIRGWEAVEMLS